MPGTGYEIPVRGWWQARLAKKILLCSSCALDVGPSLNNFPCVSRRVAGPWAQGELDGLSVGFWWAFGGLLVGCLWAFGLLLVGFWWACPHSRPPARPPACPPAPPPHSYPQMRGLWYDFKLCSYDFILFSYDCIWFSLLLFL